MANLQLYSLLFPSVDGALLIEETSVQIDRSTSSQPVNTVAKGYAGESPGAPMCEYVIDSAMPQGGFEFDAGQKMAGLVPADVYVQGPGGQTLKGKCFIISDTIKHSVNTPSSYTFKARGPMTLFS